MRIYHTIPLMLSLILAFHASGNETLPMEDFEREENKAHWSFNDGSEFPGANGEFVFSEEAAYKGEYGGELQFDFTEGGHYVAAVCDLSSLWEKHSNLDQVAGMEFWLWCPQGHRVGLRYTDTTGQVLQTHLDFEAGKWSRVVAPFEHWETSWGGKDDGIRHGLPQKIAILIDHGEQDKGSLLFDEMRLIPGESEDLMSVAEYKICTFEEDDDFWLASSGNRGDTRLDGNKLTLDFSQGADWISLRFPDRSLLGRVEEFQLKVNGEAKGHPLTFYARTHFMTFYKNAGTFDADGVQKMTLDAPPGEDWNWSGGENDGKLHGPLRLHEIRFNANGNRDQCQLDLISLSACASSLPHKQVLMYADTQAQEEELTFSAHVKGLLKEPLQGTVHWTLKTWDNEVLKQGKESITIPARNQESVVHVNGSDVIEENRFIEAVFQLEAEGQSVPEAYAYWMKEHRPHGDPKIDLQSPFGMGLYLNRYGGHEEGLKQMEHAARMGREAGVKWTREDFSWSRIEPRKGEFNWDFYDQLIACAKRNGIQVYPIVCYWSSWTKPYTDEGIDDYINYLEAMVRRYKDDLHHWEIWNEPNIFFWKGTKEQYATLLKRSYKAIKNIDPTAQVLGISTAGIDIDYIKDMLEMEVPFDVLTIHPYRRVFDDHEFIEDLKEASQVVERKDRRKRPVWLTELGWATYVPHNALKQSFIPTSQRKQAELIARVYLSSIISGVEPRTFWYNFRNDGTDPFYFEHNMGIVRRDFEPKPAYYAYSTLTRWLKDKKEYKKITIDNEVMAFRFFGEDSKDSVLVLWTPEESREVTVQVKSDAVILVNTIGEEKQLNVQEDELTLSLHEGATVYLVEKDSRQ